MSDGQASLPKLTQLLLDSAHWIKGRGGLNFLAVALISLIPIILIVQPRFRRCRPQEARLLSRLSDQIKWHLPIVHGFECAYAQLQLIEILKVGLRAGYPVNTTIRNGLGLDMNHCYRHRMVSMAATHRTGRQYFPVGFAARDWPNAGLGTGRYG